ncbi:hypothetical protein NDK47_02870 [Brevibacillus ruminantium]|uniref:Uncharacterized protein n=1 Tax=Brevibacillus ruminantium TaxID=2950604 RepID=A0ABY4WGT3_9BACL|nr:hypothetical protein [Brevibacillus ruminantium]USG66292.1 hypothetical protein NDK47_02870 [Brevibacillus ruminantium]
MKKLVSVVMAVALISMLHPLETTVSFLTSEKKQRAPVSLGTNEDVFLTETESIQIVTEVTKKVTITRKSVDGEEGGGEEASEERDVKFSIQEGAFYLRLKPQRPHLDLDEQDLQVTGEAKDLLQIERQDSEEDIVFRIGHIRSKVEYSDDLLTGELHITALGGFYQHVIPLTVETQYKESTHVISVPSPPPIPGVPGSPPPGGTPAPVPNPLPPEQPPTETPPVPPVPGTENPAPPSPGEAANPSPPGTGGENPPAPGTGGEPAPRPGTGSGNPSPPGAGGEPAPSPGQGGGNPSPPGAGGEPAPQPGPGSGNPSPPGTGGEPAPHPGTGSENPSLPGAGGEPAPSAGTGSEKPSPPGAGGDKAPSPDAGGV